MHSFLSWIFFGVIICFTKSFHLSPEDQCMVNIRKEFKGERNISRNLGGIVGTGLDALTNAATLPILSITYNDCRTVPDGDFLIPDNIIVFPIKEANIQAASTIHDSLTDFKLEMGGSYDTSAGFGLDSIGASGSFSVEAQLGVKHMRHQKQTCFLNKVEYHAFDLIATESAGFHPTFLQQIKEIADAIEEDDMLLAQYEAENLISNYGTHVTNKALAGASITMLSFTKLDDSHTSVSIKANLSGSKLHVDSVVGIKFSGVPLYTLIHENSVKIHKNTTMKIVQELITDATQEYFRHNTIPGCMDRDKTNYFYKANVDDNSCRDSFVWPGFGGVFQKCENIGSYSEENGNFTSINNCEKYERVNPYTEDYTCVDGFLQRELDSFYVTVKNRTHSVKFSECTNSSSDCYKNFGITDEIKVTAYWCERDFELIPDYSTHILFGGIFSTDNVFSDNKGCPNGFTEYPFLHNLKICMTPYNNNGLLETVVSFSGMITCHNKIQECPNGYSRYLATTIDHCSYYYCATWLSLYEKDGAAQTDGKKPLMSSSVSKPPYIDRTLAMKKIRYHHKQQMKSA